MTDGSAPMTPAPAGMPRVELDRMSPLSVGQLGLCGRTTEIGWELPADLSETDWREAGIILHKLERSVPWWIGDWWAYGEQHYGSRTAAVNAPDWIGPSFATCVNAATVCRRFETPRRRGHLFFSHHAEVASLPSVEADALLDAVEREGLSVRALRARAHTAKPAEAIPLPDGKYGTIVIDPPWQMQKIEREVRPNQAGFDYPTMTEEQLMRFPVLDMAAEHCHLFCWTTQKFLRSAINLVETWGFHYICLLVWHKAGGFQPMNLPQFNGEFVVYARYGSPTFVDTKAFPACFSGERREHSRKPDTFYDMVRRVTGDGRIDVFSREARLGFAQYGNEIARFTE